MKTTSFTPIVGAVLAGLMATALVVGLPTDADAARANPRRGKVFYKANCRTCHDGSTEAVELSPLSKTISQWMREFSERGEVQTCLNRLRDHSGNELTEQDLLDIQTYLVQHAADSDQPATCGN